jgi:hypothetical protein
VKLRNAIMLVILAELLVAGLGAWNFGWSIEGLQGTTRFSGRLSLLIFSFIFLLHPGDRPTLRFYFSDQYFLIFAIAHGIHLVELVSYVSLAGIPLVPYRVAGGFLAYSFIFLMPWLYRQAAQGKITTLRFGRLSLTYQFYVWFIFFMTYLSRVNGSFPNAGDSRTLQVALMGWVCIMMGAKIFQLMRKKKVTEAISRTADQLVK